MKSSSKFSFLIALSAVAAALVTGCSFSGGTGPSSALQPTDLRCEYRANPVGVDEVAPRLSWQLRADPAARGVVQSAYKILVASDTALLAQDRGDLWTAEVKSADTAQIVYAGRPLTAEAVAYWKVQVVDGAGRRSAWSAPAQWSMGLLNADAWHAAWIGLDDVKPSGAAWLPPAQPGRTYLPVTELRKDFTLAARPTRAVLYVTALGSVEPRLNGRRVADEFFTPGWTDYRKRLYYRAYDVTALVQAGANTLGALLGDGWFRGNIGSFGQDRYGQHTRLRAELHLFDAAGQTQVIATDATWKASTGPILEADMQAGESYDARLTQPGWDAPGFDAKAWQPVATGAEFSPAIIRAHPAPPVRRVAERPTVAVTVPKPGVYVFDLGQNFAGFARLQVREPAGTVITLRFGEMLKADGTIYTENLRLARVIDTYVCKGGGEETWEPHFTFHGFRYVQVTGLTQPPPAATITGVVLSTGNTDTGEFESSSALLNQIWSNAVWGQRSNYLEVPTDCPQRDERLGWTGDAQVFVRTGAYNQDIAAFMSKWEDDLVDTQTADGHFNDTAPVGFKGVAAGWGDAGIIIPWTLWRMYGDTRVLDRHYDAMRRHLDYVRAQSPGLIGPNRGYGDWLAIGGVTEKDLISTAYFAYDAKLMADIAGALGKTADAAAYRQLFDEVCAAFRKKFINADGSIGAHRSQTAHLLALRFGLLTPAQRAAAIPHLVQNLEDRNWRLGVGFLGVNLLLPTLTDIGYTDGAYYTITGTEFPSWGYSVAQGATTIWERWNSFTKAHGFGDPGMNSFNHYAYGSCVEWLYRTVLGIDTAEAGFRRVLINPEPGPGVTSARGHYDSIRGRIATDWKLENGELALTVTLPPNVTGEIHVPTAAPADVREGGQPAASAYGLKFLRVEQGDAVYEAGSGTYHFRAPCVLATTVLPPVPGKSNAAEEEQGPKITATPGTAGRFTLNTKIGLLLDDPQAKAALLQVIPEAIKNPDFAQARESTFAQLHDFAPDYFTTERLQLIATALAKLNAPKWSVETSKVGELLADPQAKAVLQKHLAEALANPDFSQAYGMTLRALHDFSPDYFTDARLKAISDDLAALDHAAPAPSQAPSAKASPAAAPAAAPAATAETSLNFDAKIGTLLDHPATKAILAKYLGAMIDSPSFAAARGITLKQLQPYVKDTLTDEKLKLIAEELKHVAPAGYSLDTKIGDLLDDPASKAVLAKHLAAMIASPQFAMARGLTLRQLQPHAKEVLTDAVLTTIAGELAQLSGAKPAAPAPGAFSADTKMGVLLANPAAKAVLEKALPKLMASPQIGQARDLTLRQMQPYFPELLTTEKLRALEAELVAVTGSAETTQTAGQPPVSASLAAWSADVLIGMLMDNEGTQAVLMKHLPEVFGNPQIAAARQMPLRKLQPYVPMMTDAVLAAMDRDLRVVPVPPGTVLRVESPATTDPLKLVAIPLWEKGAPGAMGERVTDKPSLTVFAPDPIQRNGTAIIVAPGGAYQALATNLEGRQVADWFAAHGVTAFVLTYRLISAGYYHPAQLNDGQRAVRWVRAHAKEYGIDPNRVGMIGFSAGGHLTTMVATRGDAGNPKDEDPVERMSSMLNFMVLCYPGVLRTANLTSALLGPHPDPATADWVNTEKYLGKNVPPTFVFQTADDQVVAVERVQEYVADLEKAGVPVEMHLYPHGPHGTGLGLFDPALRAWPVQLEKWLDRLGLLGASGK